MKLADVEIKSSEGNYPEVLRCKKCMKTHTPFKRFCKWSTYKRGEMTNRDPVVLNENIIQLILHHIRYLETQYNSKIDTRLRGGAWNWEGTSSTLVYQAINSANKHGIKLVQGTLNSADGNCAFDAVINNINHRQCFSDKLTLSSRIYRQIWVSDLQGESSRFPSLGAGYSKEEKDENWNQLKQSGVYEIDFFGDLVIHAIARGCHKDILIFNTNLAAADPIYVIKAEEFGGYTDSDIPVVVGYNQVHYESLHPANPSDIEKTKHLVNSYIDGSYQFKKNDIQFLISSASDVSQHEKEKLVKNKTQYNVQFPPLPNKISRQNIETEDNITAFEVFSNMQGGNKMNLRHCNIKPIHELPISSKTKIVEIKETKRKRNKQPKKQIGKHSILTKISKSIPSKKRVKIGDTNDLKIPYQDNLSDYLVAPNKGITKTKKIKDMTKVEIKEYNQLKQRANRYAEKAAERVKKRKNNKEGFKKEIASEKATGREKKRKNNKEAFKKERASEKATGREKKSKNNEEAFKKERASEKAAERVKKKKNNKEDLRKK